MHSGLIGIFLLLMPLIPWNLKKKTCKVIYSKYVNIAGAFRPRLVPSGLWEYKNCNLNEDITRQADGSLGRGNRKHMHQQTRFWIRIHLILEPHVECLKAHWRNRVTVDFACKEYFVKLTYKYKPRIEKEVKWMMKLKHPNVLQHLGFGIRQSNTRHWISVERNTCKTWWWGRSQCMAVTWHLGR